MSVLEPIVRVASHDFMIEEVIGAIKSEMTFDEQVELISNIGMKYPESSVTPAFDPWIYLAGYSFSKGMFWEENGQNGENGKGSLDEIKVCHSFITFGYRQGYSRNLLGLTSRDIAEKILHNTIKICVVGNRPFDNKTIAEINSHDIVVRCNRADNFVPTRDKVDYLVYRTIIFDQSVKFRNKLKTVVSSAKVVVEVDGAASPSERLKIPLRKSQIYYPLNVENLDKGYNYKKKKTHVKKPSTGFCAIQMMLHLYSLANINLYGFTFDGTYHHNWKYEKAYCEKNERVFVRP